MPENSFFTKINKNPLVVEGDIFGEYFGKGRLPLMLDKHLKAKFEYCEKFNPAGYVARIDRNKETPFGDVNEVNVSIMSAYLNGNSPETAIDKFFKDKYPQAHNEVRAIMEETEDVLKKTIYIKGFVFAQLSLFPDLNHCKNHYYFEMMRENYKIDSNEWFIPKDWDRGEITSVIEEKQAAVDKAGSLLKKLEELQDKIDSLEYKKLWIKFANLLMVTKIWKQLLLVHISYARYFETKEASYEKQFEEDIKALELLSHEGKSMVGEDFYCMNGNNKIKKDFIADFITEVTESFRIEKETTENMSQDKDLIDYIICGGASESHCLFKEVNFSDTYVRDGALCRIPGSKRGMNWSTVNAHGWFSYKIGVRKFEENIIKVVADNPDEQISMRVTIDEKEYVISDKVDGKKEYEFRYKEEKGNDFVKIRFDKISGYTPFIYTIKTL